MPGLRREELAYAAGISVAYYTRIEQGKVGQVSDAVIDALARTLALDASEHAHLRNLVLAGRRTPTVPPANTRLHEIRTLLGAMSGVAYATGPRGDLLAWNEAATALFGDWGAMDPADRNWGPLLFEHPGYQDVFADWEGKAADFAGFLRAYAGRHPDDPEVGPLVERLSASAVFRRMWASQDVRELSFGTKLFRHPAVGDMELRYEVLHPPADPELFLVSLHPEPGSESADRLRRLVDRRVSVDGPA